MAAATTTTTETRICSACKVVKPLDAFYRNRADKIAGRQWTCSTCQLAHRRARFDADPEYWRRRHLSDKYGLTVEDYDQMLAAQSGVCAVCFQPETREVKGVRTLSVDHCHETGQVRGLLCQNCNAALGMLRNSAEILRSAISYLERSER